MPEHLRRFDEVTDYGRTTIRSAYVFDPIGLPAADREMNWKEVGLFEDDDTELQIIREEVRRSGVAVVLQQRS